MTVSGGDLEAGSLEWEEQNDFRMECSAAHLELVEDAWDLLNAQRRINEA